MRISPTGAWLDEGGHTFDANFAAVMADMLRGLDIEDVVDIGCGDGSYTRFLDGEGFICVGYDGNPNTPDPLMVADFSEPQYLGVFDAALCLEVGEHIPRDYETVFIDNLCRHAGKVIVLSWAIPRQGGLGHVNERSSEYIIDKLLQRDWRHDPARSQTLRDAATICYWFKNTVMVFTHGH